MKRSNKGFDYCFNAQAVVDSAYQIIVAAETTGACPGGSPAFARLQQHTRSGGELAQ